MSILIVGRNDTGLVVETFDDNGAAEPATPGVSQTTLDDAISGVNDTVTFVFNTFTGRCDVLDVEANSLLLEPATANLADGDATIGVAVGSPDATHGSLFNLPGQVLTLTRTLTLSPTSAAAGDILRIVVHGQNTLTNLVVVNGGPGMGTLWTAVKVPAKTAARFAEFKFDGTNWSFDRHAYLKAIGD